MAMNSPTHTLFTYTRLASLPITNYVSTLYAEPASGHMMIRSNYPTAQIVTLDSKHFLYQD